MTTFILCTGDESCGEIVFCHNCNISCRGALNDMDPRQSWHDFIVVVVFWVMYQGEVKDHSGEWNSKTPLDSVLFYIGF